MSIKLSDYIHYYLGQHVQLPDGATYLLKPSNLPSNFSETIDPIHGKLLLRPLSDMAESEMKELLTLRYADSRDVFEGMNYEITFDINEPQRINKRGNGVRYMLKKGDKVEQDGTLSFNENNPQQTSYLLKQGFDLFGLIDAGLAVDKTKMLESAK